MAFSFFEGPEKKVELTVVDEHRSLRSYGRRFWDEVVSAAEAQVISVRSNDTFDAYLLSESSLFVYDSFVTMITCGRTRLVDAVIRILEDIPPDAIAVLIYERKNENFPHEQPTSFFDDAQALSRRLEGRALRFGFEHEHAVRLFHTARPYVPDADDRTLEVLMHGIDLRLGELFRPHPEAGAVAPRLGLDAILRGYELNEHVFAPVGYSLNGMRDEAYVTLHVTPERVGSYVSFETNRDIGPDPSALVKTLVERFRPESFDVMAFVPDAGPLAVEVPGYRTRAHVQEPVSGYQVTFQHFYRPSVAVQRAFEIELASP